MRSNRHLLRKSQEVDYTHNKSSPPRDGKGGTKMCYHVVVDLEMCKVPKSNRTRDYKWADETIQIGAVLLNDNYEIIDKFNTLVLPELGHIDGYIKNFTGIDNKDVAEAPKMAEAVKMFTDWIPEGDIEMVSWSMSDANQFRHELIGKGIENSRMEELLENWNDCQETFSEKLESDRSYNLGEALVIADIIQEGKAHDGLYDAYNTALLFVKMETEPEFKLNSIFENARNDEVEHLSSSLGDLFKGLDLQLAS